ncbi:MAG: cyanophycinase [Oligoflexales bacterium]
MVKHSVLSEYVRFGPLLLIGGREDRTKRSHILKEFVHLSGGDEGHIVIVTTASEHAAEVGQEYVEVFQRLTSKEGKNEAAKICTLDIQCREAANNDEAVAVIENASGVFFTGGDQYRITSVLGGTKVDVTLHRRHESGLVLAGTSAGASMMSSTMIIEGSNDSTMRLGMVKLGPGLEFMPGAIIDQHFAERGRIHRLLSAVAQYPHHLGIGIDEDTAIISQGHQLTVIGSGAVTIVDAGEASAADLSNVKHGDIFALTNVKLHILPADSGFDMLRRQPLINQENGFADAAMGIDYSKNLPGEERL